MLLLWQLQQQNSYTQPPRNTAGWSLGPASVCTQCAAEAAAAARAQAQTFVMCLFETLISIVVKIQLNVIAFYRQYNY